MSCAFERFTEPAEGVPRPGAVALGEALGGVAERRCRGAVRLRGRRAELRQLPGELAPLLLGHPVELLGELVEVLTRLFRIAVRVRIGLPGGRPRQRSAERGHRRRALLVRGVELAANAGFGRRHPGEIVVELARLLTKLAGKLAELLGQLVTRVVGAVALRLEVSRDLLDPLGLPVGLLADALVRCDDVGLRVRDQEHRRKRKRGNERDGGRRTREPRLEQARPDDPQGRERVAPLTPDELLGVGRLVGLRARRVIRVQDRAGAGVRRERDRQLERARDTVSQPSFGVHGQRGLADRRPSVDDRRDERDQPNDGDRDADDRGELDRDEAGHGPQEELRHHDRRESDPRPPNDPPQPQSTAVRYEPRPDREERRVERAGDRASRVRWHDGCGLARRADRSTERESGAHQAALRGRRNRIRQRRVGDTSWTDTAIRTADSTSHAATLRGQNALRLTPNCCTGITSDETNASSRPTPGAPTAMAMFTAGIGSGSVTGASENTTTAVAAGEQPGQARRSTSRTSSGWCRPRRPWRGTG